MPSYPAKPYVVPDDDWFNNNSINFNNKSKSNETKNLSTIHEFFYKQSNLKVGGSNNHMQTKLEKKPSKKVIISYLQNSDKNSLSKTEEKYSYSKILKELESIKKRSIKGEKSFKNSSNKEKINFRTYFLDLKSIFLKIISKIRN